MKTDDLISLMAQDAPVRVRLGRIVSLALIGAAIVAFASLLATIGLRSDLGLAVETVRVLFKVAITLAFALGAGSLLLRIGQPGVPVRGRVRLLLLSVGVLALGVGLELLVLPMSAWRPALMGHYALFCLVYIPAFAALPLVMLLAALRHAAPADPGLAGAAAGLAAGTIAAAVYALHCVDDSPLFLATWYSLAILMVAAVGYLVGRRLLRW